MSENSTVNFSNTFLLKGGKGAPPNNILQERELGWDLENKQLYIGIKNEDENEVESYKILSPLENYLSLEGGEINGDLTIKKNLEIKETITTKNINFEEAFTDNGIIIGGYKIFNNSGLSFQWVGDN